MRRGPFWRAGTPSFWRRPARVRMAPRHHLYPCRRRTHAASHPSPSPAPDETEPAGNIIQCFDRDMTISGHQKRHVILRFSIHQVRPAGHLHPIVNDEAHTMCRTLWLCSATHQLGLMPHQCTKRSGTGYYPPSGPCNYSSAVVNGQPSVPWHALSCTHEPAGGRASHRQEPMGDGGR